MSTNEFDKLLNEKFDQHEFAYNHAGWERLVKELPQNNSRKVISFTWMKVTGIAAALAITISGVAWYYQSQNKQESIVAVTSKPSQQTETASLQKLPENKQEETAAILLPANNNHTSSLAISSISNRKEVVDDKDVASTPIAQQLPENKQSNFEEAKDEIVNITPQESPIKPQSVFSNENAYEPKSKLANKTFFSLTGGMNYGSMNTGYMAGINAKQKLGRKLFVEGDLAVVNNNASQTFTQQQKQIGIASKTPIDYQDANLVYVAFNPTVGYQVMKNVSLGVGADVQRMINGDDLLVQVDDETEKTIPGTDIGLTGKTEVSLSRRLKAGVLYREGINNFLNGGSQFFDRRYLQVQLKFTVIGK